MWYMLRFSCVSQPRRDHKLRTPWNIQRIVANANAVNAVWPIYQAYLYVLELTNAAYEDYKPYHIKAISVD